MTDEGQVTHSRRPRALAFLVGVLIVGTGMWWLVGRTAGTQWIDEPLTLSAPAVTVTVERGMSGAAIGRLLVREGVLPSTRHFQQLLRITGGADKLRAGVYTVTPEMTPRALVALLQSPTSGGIRVALIDGWTTDQMADALVQVGLLTDIRELADAARAHPKLQEWAPGRADLEGYLFPDTYLFVPGMSAPEIVDRMVRAFENEVDIPALTAAAASHDLTLDQAVTLASIVQREARTDDERATIAGLFFNRLHDGMKLESCATVNYALGDWSKSITIADTRLDHPYNTYRIDGLPPGPICNPGPRSLAAVISPEATENLFFVYDPALGHHRFSRTYAAHQRAIRDINAP